jgi:hypothetical protein
MKFVYSRFNFLQGVEMSYNVDNVAGGVSQFDPVAFDRDEMASSERSSLNWRTTLVALNALVGAALLVAGTVLAFTASLSLGVSLSLGGVLLLIKAALISRANSRFDYSGNEEASSDDSLDSQGFDEGVQMEPMGPSLYLIR